MAGEGDGGAEEKRAGLEGPSGEGGDEACGLEGVIFVVLVVDRKVRGHEAEWVVLGTEVEEVVMLGLTLFDHVVARDALSYGPP